MKKTWTTCPMIEGRIYRYGEEVDETQPGVAGYIAANPSSYKTQIEKKTKPKYIPKKRGF